MLEDRKSILSVSWIGLSEIIRMICGQKHAARLVLQWGLVARCPAVSISSLELRHRVSIMLTRRPQPPSYSIWLYLMYTVRQ